MSSNDHIPTFKKPSNKSLIIFSIIALIVCTSFVVAKHKKNDASFLHAGLSRGDDTPLFSSTRVSLSNLEKNILHSLLLEEARSIVDQNNSILDWEDIELSAPINATALSQAYGQNEVSADNRFRDKIFIVVGKIESIDKDILGVPVVRLRGQNIVMGVSAYFDKSEMTLLSELRKGQIIKLGCIGGGSALGNVRLDSCKQAVKLVYNAMIEHLNDFLRGENVDSVKFAQVLAFSLFLADKVDNQSACQDANNYDACVSDIRKISRTKISKQEIIGKLSRVRETGIISQDLFNKLQKNK